MLGFAHFCSSDDKWQYALKGHRVPLSSQHLHFSSHKESSPISNTSRRWQWPCGDINQLSSILGRLPSGLMDLGKSSWLSCPAIQFSSSVANALLPQALLVRLGIWDMGAQVLPLQFSGLVKIPLLQCAELNALHQKDETRGNLSKMYFLSENTLKMLTWLDLARGISIYTNQGWSKIYWSQWKNSLASKQFGWKAWDAQKGFFWAFCWANTGPMATSEKTTLIFQDVRRHIWETSSSLDGKGGANPENRGTTAEHLSNIRLQTPNRLEGSSHHRSERNSFESPK